MAALFIWLAESRNCFHHSERKLVCDLDYETLDQKFSDRLDDERSSFLLASAG
jgi:hypothetical protein